MRMRFGDGFKLNKLSITNALLLDGLADRIKGGFDCHLVFLSWVFASLTCLLRKPVFYLFQEPLEGIGDSLCKDLSKAVLSFPIQLIPESLDSCFVFSLGSFLGLVVCYAQGSSLQG